MIVGQLALVTAASFASASVYINAVEQPARLEIEPGALLAEWKVSYRRGTIMQVSLAVTAALLGLATYIIMHDWRWLFGALTFLLLLPYTFMVVMPINRRLTSISADAGHGSVRGDVRRWGFAHSGRTVLGTTAVLIYLWASS